MMVTSSEYKLDNCGLVGSPKNRLSHLDFVPKPCVWERFFSFFYMNAKQDHHTPKKQADADYQAAMQSYFSRPDYLLTHLGEMRCFN